MPQVVNFYLDDSGTRHPDHAPGKRAAHGYDWFALGGVLVKEEEEKKPRGLYTRPFATGGTLPMQFIRWRYAGAPGISCGSWS